MTFKPFADDASVLTIGDATLENGTDAVVLSATEVTRDRAGLDHVERVIAALRTVADALRAEPDLPAVAKRVSEAPVSVANPFATKG